MGGPTTVAGCAIAGTPKRRGCWSCPVGDACEAVGYARPLAQGHHPTSGSTYWFEGLSPSLGRRAGCAGPTSACPPAVATLAMPSPRHGSAAATNASRSPAEEVAEEPARRSPVLPSSTACISRRPWPTCASTTTAARWRRRGSAGTSPTTELIRWVPRPPRPGPASATTNRADGASAALGSVLGVAVVTTFIAGPTRRAGPVARLAWGWSAPLRHRRCPCRSCAWDHRHGTDRDRAPRRRHTPISRLMRSPATGYGRAVVPLPPWPWPERSWAAPPRGQWDRDRWDRDGWDRETPDHSRRTRRQASGPRTGARGDRRTPFGERRAGQSGRDQSRGMSRVRARRSHRRRRRARRP